MIRELYFTAPNLPLLRPSGGSEFCKCIQGPTIRCKVLVKTLDSTHFGMWTASPPHDTLDTPGRKREIRTWSLTNLTKKKTSGEFSPLYSWTDLHDPISGETTHQEFEKSEFPPESHSRRLSLVGVKTLNKANQNKSNRKHMEPSTEKPLPMKYGPRIHLEIQWSSLIYDPKCRLFRNRENPKKVSIYFNPT